jgi:hypothetical protein
MRFWHNFSHQITPILRTSSVWRKSGPAPGHQNPTPKFRKTVGNPGKNFSRKPHFWSLRFGRFRTTFLREGPLSLGRSAALSQLPRTSGFWRWRWSPRTPSLPFTDINRMYQYPDNALVKVKNGPAEADVGPVRGQSKGSFSSVWRGTWGCYN